ncbi:MAG: hypothetical protein R3305_11780 [Gammaproteobacteria bacterium]|nr:hypothetical protein [Gammaproteobacteria bacterium]
MPPLMASELVDPLWAPDMEATIDGSIRSIGSLIADVEVECRTMRCRALIFFQPSLFQLEEPKVRSHVMTTFDRLNEIGDTLIRQSDRLDEASGMGFVGLGELTDRPIDEFNQHEFTAIIWHIGAASPAN